jgi:hypothetical protein
MKTEKTMLFFDFYTLSLLNYFAGDTSLNHEGKVRRIRDTYEQKVDELYEDIKRSLTYSVTREFRHYIEYGPCDKPYVDLAKKICHEYRTGLVKVYLNKEETRKKLDTSDVRLRSIADGFMMPNWDDNYGGKLWGIAARFLLEKPETTKSKELWVDRVLDLQHNNGHILNKTNFAQLERHAFPRIYSYVSNKRIKAIYNEYNALDYRRYAKTLSDLTVYASPRINRLVVTNLNFIPEMLR